MFICAGLETFQQVTSTSWCLGMFVSHTNVDVWKFEFWCPCSLSISPYRSRDTSWVKKLRIGTCLICWGFIVDSKKFGTNALLLLELDRKKKILITFLLIVSHCTENFSISDVLIGILNNICEYRWLGLIGQFRPKKLISSIKAEFSNGGEWELPGFKDVAKHFMDKSLYSLGLCSQLSLSSSSSIMLSTEGHGERKGRRHKMMLFQKARIAAIFLYIFLIFYKQSYRTPSFLLQNNFSR